MKTAPILRQMPVASSPRLLGQAPQPHQRQHSHPAAKASSKTSFGSPPVAAAPAQAAPALSEAEIEQRSLAIAQRMMRTEAEQLCKAAREEGLRAGKDEGLLAAQVQVAEQLKALQKQFLSVTDALVAALNRDREATEDAALELAMASLVRILGKTPDAEWVASVVRQASAQLRSSEQVCIRLAPADIELLNGAGIEPASLAPQAAEVRWIADPGVEGGCVLQTAAGNLDARLHKQVSALAEALARTYRSRGIQA